jgi:hypothetical protein
MYCLHRESVAVHRALACPSWDRNVLRDHRYFGEGLPFEEPAMALDLQIVGAVRTKSSVRRVARDHRHWCWEGLVSYYLVEVA